MALLLKFTRATFCFRWCLPFVQSFGLIWFGRLFARKTTEFINTNNNPTLPARSRKTYLLAGVFEVVASSSRSSLITTDCNFLFESTTPRLLSLSDDFLTGIDLLVLWTEVRLLEVLLSLLVLLVSLAVFFSSGLGSFLGCGASTIPVVALGRCSFFRLSRLDMEARLLFSDPSIAVSRFRDAVSEDALSLLLGFSIFSGFSMAFSDTSARVSRFCDLGSELFLGLSIFSRLSGFGSEFGCPFGIFLSSLSSLYRIKRLACLRSNLGEGFQSVVWTYSLIRLFGSCFFWRNLQCIVFSNTHSLIRFFGFCFYWRNLQCIVFNNTRSL